MFVVREGVGGSKGTKAELARAKELGILDVWRVDELCERFPASP